MSTFLDRILIACALIAMVQCSIRPAPAADIGDCRYLANIAAQAVLMHQEYGLGRERYLVAWLDPDSDWAREGERVLDEAFEFEGKPYDYGQLVFTRCMGAHGYGYSIAECAAHKVKVDLQADPTGTKTVTVCAEESDLPDLLAPGERT